MVKNIIRNLGKSKTQLIITITLLVLLTDILSKLLVKKTIEIGTSISVIPNIFHITHHRNFGAGFGILQNQGWFLILVAVAVLAGIFYYYNQLPKNKLVWVAVALLISGTIGNLLDRITVGYVTDFLDFRVWPIFNVADIALTVGVGLLILYLIREP